jgi:hypothetical protein
MKRKTFNKTLLAAGAFSMVGCKKTPNTTPRYEKDACLVCSRYGHSDDAGKCFYCKGSGACKFCNGKGKRLLGKKNNFYEAECAFCGGSGKCHYCQGSGKCGICNGTGKYMPLRPKEKEKAVSPEGEKESVNENKS